MLKRMMASALFVIGLLFLMGVGATLAHGGIHAEPETARPGETVTVSGEDFEPNSTVKITLHGYEGALKVARTDATGAFTVDVVIPTEVPDGVHMLMARDETAEMAQFRLTVDPAVGMPSQTILAYIIGGVSIVVLVAGVVGKIMTRNPRQAVVAS